GFLRKLTNSIISSLASSQPATSLRGPSPVSLSVLIQSNSHHSPEFDCDVFRIDQLGGRLAHAENSAALSGATHHVGGSTHRPKDETDDDGGGQERDHIGAGL